MTFHKFVSLVCTIITAILFWLIELVIEPYCIVQVYIAILSGLFVPSIILVHWVFPLLPSFQSCRFDVKVESKPKSKMATKLETKWETKMVTKVEAYLPPFIVEIKEEIKLETKLKTSLNPCLNQSRILC